MSSRISPIVLATNAVRTGLQLVVAGAFVIAAFAALRSAGYQFAPVVRFVNDALVGFVTG